MDNTRPLTQYQTLYRAYAHFNDELFDGELPPAMLVLHRKSRAAGYFHGSRYLETDRLEEALAAFQASGQTLDPDQLQALDEISLNPDHLARGDRDTMATLVHEMVHLWQYHHGTPSRRGYHNREWAVKMEDVGLIPSDTGEPGGKKTGQKMTHYVQDGGPFHQSYKRWAELGERMGWSSFELPAKASAQRTKSKVKFTCPICEANGWGKPASFFICGHCMETMVSELEEIG